MRVLVTGATGNVGTAVLRALAADDEVQEIVGVARRAPSTSAPKVRWAAADVRSDELDRLMEGVDGVVHLAWLIQPSRDRATLKAVNVDGSRRVFDAARRAGVRVLVHASSVGTYAAGPKDRRVDESWPATGVRSSSYARDKAACERMLDDLERDAPELRVVRLRPGLIFQRAAASEIRRFFVGPLLPGFLLRRELVPVVPKNPRLAFQAVHSDDVGEAYRLALRDDGARGAYNVAAEPVIDGAALGRMLGARPVPVPGALLRLGADLSWRARLQPTDPGWVDLGLGVPLMDIRRAREELGWSPSRSAQDAFLELFEGLREGAGHPTPPLDPQAGGPGRAREVLSGIGGSGEPRR
ncbi:MAG TPA: NAD-dependent epimerase/dehydratase family protein [Solirubrobacteraceae bacterium]|nr:NAD-dependent epimerase/dehydratase family protein [Solirubrobacteraceae bacterium]